MKICNIYKYKKQHKKWNNRLKIAGSELVYLLVVLIRCFRDVRSICCFCGLGDLSCFIIVRLKMWTRLRMQLKTQLEKKLLKCSDSPKAIGLNTHPEIYNIASLL